MLASANAAMCQQVSGAGQMALYGAERGGGGGGAGGGGAPLHVKPSARVESRPSPRQRLIRSGEPGIRPSTSLPAL